MAQRPVFIPKYIGSSFVAVEYIDFEWHPGMTLGQKQKSVVSLHTSAHQALGVKNILEISTKSSNPIGSALSAFNLMMNVPDLKRPTCVECVYQGSKVFEMGGPFIDIFQMTALEAKKDSRLSTSGHLVGFSFSSIDWVLACFLLSCLSPPGSCFLTLDFLFLFPVPPLVRSIRGNRCNCPESL